MREFLALYSFNFKRMLSTWMMRLLIVLLLGGVLGGLIFLHETQSTSEIGVCFSTNIDKTEREIILAGLNQSGERHYTQDSSADMAVSVTLLDEDKPGMQRYLLTSDNSKFVSAQQREAVRQSLMTAALMQHISALPQITVESEEVQGIGAREEIIFYIVVFVLYVFILLCGSIITSSVALEKTSRVSDLLVYRLSPLQIIYSKILALYSILVLICLGAVLEVFVAVQFHLVNLSFVTDLLRDVGFDSQSTVYTVLIIALGIVVYTILYSIVGVLIKSAEQIQFSQLPVASVSLIAFILTVLCKETPDSLLCRVCLYIPTFSPFLFVLRLFSAGRQKTLEIVSIALITILFVVAGNIAIVRLYQKENL